MINTSITVYTKTGSEYGFADIENPGAGTSALTQFTLGQDIHAKGLIISSQTNAELYIPYVAIDHIIVRRFNLSGGPKDEVCGIDQCEDTKFYAQDDQGYNITELPGQGLSCGIGRSWFAWTGDNTHATGSVSGTSSDPSIALADLDYEALPYIYLRIHGVSAGTVNITIKAENGCEITFPVTVS